MPAHCPSGGGAIPTFDSREDLVMAYERFFCTLIVLKVLATGLLKKINKCRKKGAFWRLTSA